MPNILSAYWSGQELVTNGVILLNLLGALLLGMLVGYERSYHGRAAGMRTYGIVCMASAALTVIGGYPDHWFGGQMTALAGTDPTRVIQGIVTGIGFLGAGVIMREGFNISGLTTAASIWASSVIGILVGVGFYAAAMGLALLSAMVMIYLSRIEAWLPSRHAIAITMRFKPGFEPSEESLRKLATERGYEIAGGSLMIAQDHGRMEWRFVALALGKRTGTPLALLAAEMARFEGIDGFQITHARN
ncbi:putative Mg2+ transporter-C (MgtC) family protein [Pseudoduganella flava]|uniref:Protein MgtC n=1 Tax=Pseudoduganella flava TaxID=871742 RepID=A0A562PN94_9BURK|nr:MgtC/SapB family protein [Pseudoduganella flava]QGZ40498.1 MgtC/SapB family protein [Pseudoduganella flava]TWI45941.1 putative Mg2+ transporter-C (MgtC) family protein [Pseudoduganella flava]